MRTPPLSPAEASLNLPLPRPPAWIWLFTTQTGPGRVLAATSESEARSTGAPFEIGTPNSCSNALAWYSWIFIWTLPEPSRGDFGNHRYFALAYHIPEELQALELNGRPSISIAGRSIGASAPEQVRRDLLAGIDQTLHGADRLVEGFAVLAGQFDLDNTLDTLRSDDNGDADIHVLHAIFAVEIGRAGHHALLVLKVALGHRDRGRRRRIERRTGFQQVDDLGAAIAGAVDDLVDPRLRGPAHLDEIRQRNAGHRGISYQRHHGVAVAAEHEGGDVLDRDVEFVGEEIAEARGIQHARHAHHLLVRHARGLLQRPYHGVERIGDADHEGVGRVFLDAGADLLHHLEIDAQEIVAAHAGLARHPGG